MWNKVSPPLPSGIEANSQSKILDVIYICSFISLFTVCVWRGWGCWLRFLEHIPLCQAQGHTFYVSDLIHLFYQFDNQGH